MLDPELDLEADLGIDTVKQAEMFAAIRERYGIARDDTLKLRDYPTLRHVAGFVRERAGIAEPAPGPEPEPQPVDDVLATVLAVVAEQTGYPADMLDPELDLEADLGIDTVKQAEMFAAIREHYGIERDDNLKLRDYPTLRHVAGFVEERAAQAPAMVAAGEQDPAGPVEVNLDAFPRRVPVAVVRPPLEQCEPTGIALGEGSRVIVAADRGGVAGVLTTRLRKLGVEVLAPGAEGAIDGVFWLPALDVEPAFGELDADTWRSGLDARVKQLAILMRELPETTFLITGTRLGGRHGYDADGATSVMGGAVTGFAKALHRERPAALVKAVDLAPGRKTAEPAEQLLDEALRDPGALEIGYADGLRWTVAVTEESAPPSTVTLTPETTFVVTGAAGSIVSAIVADLAQAAGGGTFHLLDLAAAPDRQDPDIPRVTNDRESLKRDLAERMRAAGEKPTPKLVERELARLERAAAALDAITAIEAAGGTARWHAVDLTAPDAVRGALQDVEAADVVIHAAGLDISHPLTVKPQAEYDLVFDVKADGWFNVLRALRTPPGAIVAFSSIAGRFGNAAQTDYAAANDLLCKAISNLRRTSDSRGIAIDWTAWAEIGMASRGSIPKVMEAAGIAMLPPAVGIPAVRRELTAGTRGEVVVAGALGVLLTEDPQPVAIPGGPVRGTAATVTVNHGLEVQTELDPAQQAFLDDHRIDGTPVLPGVMGIEAFAEAAAAIAPNYTVTALEDVELQAPFKFYRDEPRALTVRALVRDGGDHTLTADCELIGRRALAGGETQTTVHFTGRVRLAREPQPAPRSEAPPELPPGTVVEHDAVYRVYFHGPAYQVLDHAFRSDGHFYGRFAGELPAAYEPGRGETMMLPRLIELCFQTAGVWELGTSGVMGLPTHVDRVLRFADADAPGRLTAVVAPREDGVDADVVDEEGRVRIRLEGYRTTALPAAFDDEALAPLRAVAQS
jgi:acyl carrier protein